MRAAVRRSQSMGGSEGGADSFQRASKMGFDGLRPHTETHGDLRNGPLLFETKGECHALLQW
jgi:hypothetical protein